MSGPSVSRDVAYRLASYIEDRRRELVASVVRSPALARPGSAGAAAVAEAFLDRLCQELEVGDRDVVNVWVDQQSDPGNAAERARIVATVCAQVSAAYLADCGPSGDVISYLTFRANELEKRFGAERRAVPKPAPSEPVSRDQVVSSFLSAMDARDRATCEHSRAVGMWCSRIAKTIGMKAEQQALAALAGTLHDIGKIATPSEILLKPGPLDAAEWETMRAHAQIGAKMLERIAALQELAPVVRGHHERVDGGGYPDGLAGDAIPLLARIVAVADAFHAMISKRPYRDAMPVDVAVEELRAGSGTQWDPRIVDAMLEIVRPSRAHQILRAARGAR